jgi:hypothetical protein
MSNKEFSCYNSIDDSLLNFQKQEIDNVYDSFTLSTILENLGTFLTVKDYHNPDIEEMKKLECNIDNLLTLFESSIESDECNDSTEITKYSFAQNFIAKYSNID